MSGKELSDKVVNKAVSSIRELNSRPSIEQFKALDRSLFTDINNHVNTKSLETCKSRALQWDILISNLSAHYASNRKTFDDYLGEEATINRVETTNGWRNFWFRVGTTLSVALVLGAVYTLAGNYDKLYLPLQHKTVTYYYDHKIQLKPPQDLTKYDAPRKVVTVTGSPNGKNPIKLPTK
jgi:hypothetical protein